MEKTRDIQAIALLAEANANAKKHLEVLKTAQPVLMATTITPIANHAIALQMALCSWTMDCHFVLLKELCSVPAWTISMELSATNVLMDFSDFLNVPVSLQNMAKLKLKHY